MSKASKARERTKDALAWLSAQYTPDPNRERKDLVVQCFYDGMNHSVDFTTLEQAYQDSGLLETYREMGLDPNLAVPRSNSPIDAHLYGIIEFVNRYNSVQKAQGSTKRLRHIHIPDGRNPKPGTKAQVLEYYEKDIETKPTQANTVWVDKGTGDITFENQDMEAGIRASISEQSGKVNPRIWCESLRSFLGRHGGMRITSDGAGGGVRWMPVQTKLVLEQMDKALEPLGARLNLFGIPGDVSDRAKGGIVHSLMTGTSDKLDALEAQMDETSKSMKAGDSVRSGQFSTIIAEADTIQYVMGLHGGNFGLTFDKVNTRVAAIKERASDLASLVGLKASAEVVAAQEKAQLAKTNAKRGPVGPVVPAPTPEPPATEPPQKTGADLIDWD